MHFIQTGVEFNYAICTNQMIQCHHQILFNVHLTIIRTSLIVQNIVKQKPNCQLVKEVTNWVINYKYEIFSEFPLCKRSNWLTLDIKRNSNGNPEFLSTRVPRDSETKKTILNMIQKSNLVVHLFVLDATIWFPTKILLVKDYRITRGNKANECTWSRKYIHWISLPQ